MSENAQLHAVFTECTNTLLDPTRHSGELLATVHTLFDAFSAAIELDDTQVTGSDREATYLPLGKAVSVQTAARCLWEHERTARFLRGVEAAVREAQRRFPGERVRLLEAGCGPFGLLALPLAVRFAPQELGFILLDYHGRSLELVDRLIDALDLRAYVIDMVEADATTWRCPEAMRPHVLVSETMKEALIDEPQVAIVGNLVPQLMPGGLMVPQSIQVDACLYMQTDLLNADTRSWVELGPLIDLNIDTATDEFHRREIAIPDPVPERHALIERTRIQVFGDIRLDHNECSLTCNRPVREFGYPAGGEQFAVEYALQPKPGFQWQKVG